MGRRERLGSYSQYPDPLRAVTFIIAEAGVNHNGDIGQAFLLCNAAKEAGADCVKFQHFRAAALQPERYDLLKPLELSDEDMGNIAGHCKAIGIEFMATPFGLPEVEFLTPLVKRWKVASGCLTNWPLLEAVRATGLPVILSTGMADMARIARALDVLGTATLLHCTSAYPCPTSEVNLAAMDALRARWGASCPVGYSDHTAGIVIALAAVSRGATVLEKHLTLDRQAVGPDHKASIEPKDFRIMVEAIRTIEQAIGRPEKRLQASETATAKAWYGD